MAADVIAAATSGGKRVSVFDRAAIFRSAHEHAKREIRWAGFKGTYRQAFAISLRAVYYAEKQAAEEAAYQASLPPIPADIAERADRLRDAAWGQRITSTGNEAFSAFMAQARHLENAARGLA